MFELGPKCDVEVEIERFQINGCIGKERWQCDCTRQVRSASHYLDYAPLVHQPQNSILSPRDSCRSPHGVSHPTLARSNFRRVLPTKLIQIDSNRPQATDPKSATLPNIDPPSKQTATMLIPKADRKKIHEYLFRGM